MRSIILHDTAREFCRGLVTQHIARYGWDSLTPGVYLIPTAPTRYTAEGPTGGERLGMVRVEDVARRRLDTLNRRDVARLGFPGVKVDEFLRWYCRRLSCTTRHTVAVIRWRIIQHQQDLFGHEPDQRNDRPRAHRA